jgi:hypothetical protein
MDSTNIHVGAGVATLNPDSDPITFDSSNEGATWTFAGELEPISVDQVLAPVAHFVPGEECSFEMMIPEGTATYLKYALGATDQTVSTQTADGSNKAYNQINFGGNYIVTDYVFEYKAKRRNAANLYIIIRLHKVNISPNLEAAYTKDGVTYYKLTLKACADTTKDAGEQLGYYRQETADVTGTTPTLAVSSSTPADDATDVAITTDIDIVFNRNVKPESVIAGNFSLIQADTYAGVSCTVAFTGDAGTNVTVTPSANLSNSTTYILHISKNVRALDDNTAMADDVYVAFTTIAA